MNVSSKSRYALRALVELELRTGGVARPVRLAELARERDLPEQFLEQAFGTLCRAGLLASRRGVGGGFVFARRPECLSVLEVVEALDGAGAAAAATGGADHAGHDRADPVRIWREAENAFAQVLARTTVADLAERERQLMAGAPMYQI